MCGTAVGGAFQCSSINFLSDLDSICHKWDAIAPPPQSVPRGGDGDPADVYALRSGDMQDVPWCLGFPGGADVRAYRILCALSTTWRCVSDSTPVVTVYQAVGN